MGVNFFQLIVHDLSKFYFDEWLAYADYFYGDHSNEGLEAQHQFGLVELAPFGFYAEHRFNVAWRNHQTRNRHHWQYYLLTEDSGNEIVLPMPAKYVREMIADWAGAGRAITGEWEVSSWYAENKHKIKLHPITRTQVETLLVFYWSP